MSDATSLKDPRSFAGGSLKRDPRADPRVVAALAPFYLDTNVPAPPVTATSARAEQLEFCAGAELSFQAVLSGLVEGLAPVDGVHSETTSITRSDGQTISLHVHRPVDTAGPMPCVLHMHGGGMVILEAADPAYVRWREELAATGIVVVGVEFRNGAGKLGDHPFPAGLDDCVAAARWAASQLSELGASHLVLSGESGGGNLSLATTLRAKREGWLDQITGCYAQCPYISGTYTQPPEELPSMRENDGYFVSCALFEILAEIYDPGGVHAGDPTCWPLRATTEDLAGLPPHVISVNELDPLRDEGISYLRALLGAGVQATGRMVLGTPHGADVLLAAAVPDVHGASVRDVSGFARSLA
jgi:acetyl esterase